MSELFVIDSCNLSTETTIPSLVESEQNVSIESDQNVSIESEQNVSNESEQNVSNESEKTSIESTYFVKQTFVELITKLLLNEELKNKYALILSEDNINIITKIISQTPDIFNNFEKSIEEVIKDGKINSSDVPQLISLVQQIYKGLYNLKNIKIKSDIRGDITSSVLKFLILVMIKERKIIIDKNNEEEFYKLTYLLIDSCVSLLSFSKIIKTKGCVKSIFGK